ncbi:MAG: selenium-dependent xanthine dehydrogenase [Lachnospiraceae bacterium]|jgi:aldehyde oxidoreductase|nr:selenium-dependent xanthine dehydrogenase [Lachnospiraceae bacterium]MCI1726586.1 selenium-dependent xanthine dehydrogenase [Lachnospiraceae bacterium]
MIQFRVNGKECSVPEEQDKRLLDYLRDDLRLTAAKEGCGVGACGTCTILVDGLKAKACVFRLSQIRGREVTTLEGIPKEEMAIYEYCFGECGAVQCGFCIPGMVMAGKALLDKNLNPTRKDVKQALIGNICRCTGYKRIEDAILMAADFRREKKPVPAAEEETGISRKYIRVDVHDKVTGEAKYADDIVLPGMLYAKALRSPYPRCLVQKIDTSKAKAHPDCVAVFTAKDVPNNVGGHIVPDYPPMIAEGEETRYIGDALALVVTNRKETLDEVLKLIDLTVEERKPVTSPEEALAEGAPKIHPNGNLLTHEHLKRGDADKSLREECTHTIHRKFIVPFTDHAFMEPECAVAEPVGDDGIHVLTGGQGIYDERREISRMLNIPPEKVNAESCYVGGGFGGKEDMTVQHHAALCAWLLKRPVKIKFSRDESLKIHVKRHYMEMEFDVGCDDNGIMKAMKCTIYSDTGAYASLGGPVLQRACTHAAGPYKFKNVDINGYACYTNNIPAGAYRGFGVTQSNFGFEICLDILAGEVGISDWEMRYRNAVEPGDVLPNGQPVTEDCALKACLLAVKDVYDQEKYVGIACAFKNSGIGVGLPDVGRVRLAVKDGVVHIRTSAACIGQGIATVCEQILGQITGLQRSQMFRDPPMTDTCPDSGTTTASRQTLFTGEAVCRAARDLKADLDSGKSLQDLEGKEYYAEYFGETDKMGSDKEFPVSHIAYGYACQLVALNDDGSLKKIVAAHDVGTVINEQSALGQIEGGAVMSLGYALTEDFPMKNGRPLRDYAHLGLFRAPQVPPIEAVLITSPNVLPLACGAKGVGEISSVPTAAACENAYYKFDHKERLILPMKETYYNKTPLEPDSQSQVGLKAKLD